MRVGSLENHDFSLYIANRPSMNEPTYHRLDHFRWICERNEPRRLTSMETKRMKAKWQPGHEKGHFLPIQNLHFIERKKKFQNKFLWIPTEGEIAKSITERIARKKETLCKCEMNTNIWPNYPITFGSRMNIEIMTWNDVSWSATVSTEWKIQKVSTTHRIRHLPGNAVR